MEQRRLNGTFPELDLFFFFKLKQLAPHRVFKFSNKRREPTSTMAQRSEALESMQSVTFLLAGQLPVNPPYPPSTISAAIQ